MFNMRKYFLLSMIYTVMILFLIIGFVIVEKSAHNVIYSEKTPFLSYSFSGTMPKIIKLHFMGKDFILHFGD